MNRDYSENTLVQESAGRLLEDELGWEVEFANNGEVLGESGTFGRKNYQEILLARYFRAALKRLNPWIDETQIDEARKKFEFRLATSSALQINEEKYFLIRDGVPVTVKKPGGLTEERKASVVDFQNVENNVFLAVKELKIYGDVYRRRADIVGFVNGIPLLFAEFKKPSVDVRTAYDDNYADYQETIPQLFYYNAFVILSNGVEAKIGALGSKYEFFHEWKRLNEREPGVVALETLLRGVCKKENFLDLLENFILYDHSGGRTTKILARNHQYLGVNEAVKAYESRKQRNGKLGVFWHTQGSGKSYSMAFLAQKIRRKFAGSPTFIILTDRDELNKQISDAFENCGMLGKAKASRFIASSGDDLVRKLKGNPGFIFTLIQKFNRSDLEPIYPDHDVVIMSDEAHRSQYGIFAENMVSLLPTASRFGFTGTPLLSDDNITERTFGKYVSVYDFKRAVEDGATVPLYYENRGERIKEIENPDVTEKILDAIEAAELNPDQQEKLEREFAKEIHLLTSPNRLEVIAQDFVKHYSDLWLSGKAMFVCINKVTCVRMRDLVEKYWQEEIEALKGRARRVDSEQEAEELKRKLAWMEETETAVVVSQEQNEVQTFRKWGLDILTHRKKMETRELDKEFKDKDNPLRIVFVCAMWLTGFDVKCLSCLYLDKPLKAHALMQTIARANRVAEGKSNGLIVDYIGIVKALRKALADYTANTASDGVDPTIDKAALSAKIQEALERAEAFLAEKDFSLASLVAARDFDKIELLQEAANIVCVSAEIKKRFSVYATEIIRLSKYLDRSDIDDESKRKKDAVVAIYGELNKRRARSDTTELAVQINHILGDYVFIEKSENDGESSKRFDISKINFELLHREFARAKKKNLLVRDLETLIQERLCQMLQINPKRIDYYERYMDIIDAYNAEQDRATIEKTFIDLMEFADNLTKEEQRYAREGFENDEELAVYDLLFKENLDKKEIANLKAVAIDLLKKIKAKIAELDHWTDKSTTEANVKNLIRDVLWEGLPDSYEESEIGVCREQIYEYVYARFKTLA